MLAKKKDHPQAFKEEQNGRRHSDQQFRYSRWQIVST